MNEFEQRILETIHQIELKITEELAELRGEISSMVQKNEAEHKGLRDMVERNIASDTDRLKNHGKEIDEHSERLAKLEEWKDQFEKRVANRITISQSITAVVAVIITFLLSKFL